MNTKKLTFKGIKNVLSKDEMKNIMAGSGQCVVIGDACNASIQCCSLNCVSSGDPATGYSCAAQ